jgi:hypothetical protein
VEIVLFTGVGIVLYLLTNLLLSKLESLHGERLPGRNIIFFVIIMALSLTTFSVLNRLNGPGQSTQNNNQEQQATDGRDQPAESH